MHRLTDLFSFPCSRNNYLISPHVVYVVYIHHHVFMSFSVNFRINWCIQFFYWKTISDPWNRKGWYVQKSVISLNPFKTNENTEDHSCSKWQVRTEISAADYVSSFNYCSHCPSSQGFTSNQTFLLKIINLSKDK